jgi:hypothetical protein
VEPCIARNTEAFVAGAGKPRNPEPSALPNRLAATRPEDRAAASAPPPAQASLGWLRKSKLRVALTKRSRRPAERSPIVSERCSFSLLANHRFRYPLAELDPSEDWPGWASQLGHSLGIGCAEALPIPCCRPRRSRTLIRARRPPVLPKKCRVPARVGR